MAQRKEKVSGHTIAISNKFYILYNFDNDDEDNDKNTQKTTKKSDTFDIHDEAQDAEIEERGKVVRGRRKVSAQDHPHKNTKKSDAFDIHDEAQDAEFEERGKVVRGRRKVSAQDHPQIKMFSTNGAGIIGGKVKSLLAEVKHTQCNIVTVQETHCRTKGKIQIENFVIFEAIRKVKGGGTMIAIHECMKPKLIEEYSENFELIVVEIESKEKQIRIISGYGPQENWDEEKRLPFFLALEVEIEKANLAGKSVIIEMDANCKLGRKYIPQDPHEMTPNGSLLAAIIERQQLVVANGTSKCQGVITRRRKTKQRVEESVIDFVLVSSDMAQDIIKMEIDEERKHVLTKVTKTKNGVKIKESDHNVLITEFNLKTKPNTKEKLEVYNLKNKECQKKFKEFTTNTKMFSTVFENDGVEIDVLTKRLMKKIDGAIAKNFRKNRVNQKQEEEETELLNRRRDLKNKEDEESIKEMEEIDEKLANCAEEKFKKLQEEISDAEKSGTKMNAQKIWKMKKKICPRARDPAAAILDGKGNLLTNDNAIQERAIEVYENRLKKNEMKEELKDLEETEIKLCKARLEKCKENKTEPWNIEDLQKVLKQLKKDKSRDAYGYANELFTLSVAGDDLQRAVLMLLNKVKAKQQFPKAFEQCNITSLHKKGSKKDLENYRGVFRVTVLRSILDRLIYNDAYETINENLTDGNVGARKERGVRDNIFTMGAIVNSVINGNSKAIQVQVMDVKKCFDKLWLESAINALYDAGLRNDTLNMLYIENSNADVSVKVNDKLSKRISVKNVIMQGTVWGSLKCTTQMDEMNKIMTKDKSLQYKYKNDAEISIGVLGMVDDTLAITECGKDSIKKNAAINSFIETRRLEMHEDKSVVIHIGKQEKCKHTCPELKVHDSKMPATAVTKYLGNYVNSKGTHTTTIEERRNKGWGKVATIMGILGEVAMGTHKIEAGLLLRKAILHSSLLFTAEAWSNVNTKEIKRLEQVDTHLLKLLLEGHSKCPSVFYHLETGTLMLRHIVTKNRMMYHHHILTRNENETIRKIYEKQKIDNVKGDWYQLLMEDFIFVENKLNDEEIKKIPKETYKKMVKNMVNKAAFKEYLAKKETHKKIKKLEYEQLELQPYLKSKQFSGKERKLLTLLRSRCHPAKNNFKKMYQNNIKCNFGCNEDEDQEHIFTRCEPILKKVTSKNVKYEDIFKDVDAQKEIVEHFARIEEERNKAMEALSPGGEQARTRASQTSLDYAADVSL